MKLLIQQRIWRLEGRKAWECNCHSESLWDDAVHTRPHKNGVSEKMERKKNILISVCIYYYTELGFIAIHSFQTCTNRANNEHRKTVNTASARQTPQSKIWSLLFSPCLLSKHKAFIWTNLFLHFFYVFSFSFVFVLFCLLFVLFVFR